MSGWLSATWEANWRSFQYFNIYRLCMAGLFVLAVLLPHEFLVRLDLGEVPGLIGLAALYLLAVALGLVLALRWRHRFNLQLSIQVLIDAVVGGVFIYLAGGVGSGYGILQLVSLAAASLVGQGRLVLFYAAISTLVLLCGQVLGILDGRFESASLVQAGLLSSAFFATAILARLLGQRVMANEELARQRGEELANQDRISQRIVERMQDGMLVLSQSGEIRRLNPTAQDMLDLQFHMPISLGERVPALAVAWRRWQAGEGESASVLGRAGRELRARFESTSSSDGETLVFLEDMARVKAQVQQLKLAALGRLTASIAHEIRNPLSAIGHAGELLREDVQDAMQHRLLRIINDNVGRLDRIVSDVLALGRQSPPEIEVIGVADFCAAFIQQLIETGDVEAGRVALEAPGDLRWHFDRAHLHQVLWNLVGNALRYSSPAPASVRLCAFALGGQVELHVMDDGPGVPAMVREQIFEPFFTTHAQGTGLGLFIARELCVANGASLELGQVGADGRGGHFVLSGQQAE